MNNKKNIIVWVLIVLLLCVIGVCVYLVVDKANSVTCEEKENNQTECNCTKCNVKQSDDKTVDTTSKATEKAKDSSATSDNISMNSVFKEIIMSHTTQSDEGKLTDAKIEKVDKVLLNNKLLRYEIHAKYKCDTNSYKCVYHSQYLETEPQPDSDGYYVTTYYFYIEKALTTDGGWTCGPGACKVDKQAIYEK